MKKSLVQKALERINVKVFFVFLFLYQIIFIFQGLDFSDEGFYATFYQQIFNYPESVMFNFMYWLTGIVGGTFHYLFPQSGLLGFRILGVVATTSTIIIAYNLLKAHINTYHLRLALVLLLILISNDPKELNYDNLSMLLFVTSIYFLYKGLLDKSHAKLLIGGAFLGLNCFTRATNVLGIALALSIFYYGYINRHTMKDMIGQLLFFLGGFLLTIIGILFIMKLINHYDLFISSLNIVFSMGTDQDSGHNITHVVYSVLKKYFWSVSYVSLLFVFLTIAILAKNIIQSRSRYNLETLIKVLKLILFAAVCMLTVMGKIPWKGLLFTFIGISITAALIILLYSPNKQVRLLTFAGILILLFYPLGSEELVEMFSLWIIFPIAMEYFFNVKTIETKTNIISTHKQSFTLTTFEPQINEIRNFFIYVCLFIGLFYTYYYPYFDISNRMYMHYTVHNNYLMGIYTTKERANVINELLQETPKYIKKQDYVLAYDCIPMFHFLTETRPFMYNPWPWSYLQNAFRNKLNEAVEERKKLPVVVMQKVNTLYSNWPQNTEDDYSTRKENTARNTYMDDFLMRYNYKKVWENTAFEILVTGD